MTTISDGSTTITPDLVTGYESNRATQHLFHSVLGRSFPDVTLRPAALRTGTLSMVFATEAAALDGETLHKQAAYLTLADPDLASVGMTYVASGTIRRTLDDQTKVVWLLSVDFQEVSP